ncbi:hypothetical protein PFISCL1PPCAC_27594, partial [Pristionchus fissidentatus]
EVLIGLINGPAIGIAATTLGLMDFLVCSDSVIIFNPSQYCSRKKPNPLRETVPLVINTLKSTAMLLFGEPMSAQQALACGFVAHVFPKAQFAQKSAALVEKYSKLPRHSVLASRELIRGEKWRREMLSTHNEEYDVVRKLFLNEETMALVLGKFAKPKM